MHVPLKIKDTFLAQEITTNNIDLTLLTTHNRPSRGGRIALLYKDGIVTCKRFSGARVSTAKYLSTLAVLCGY